MSICMHCKVSFDLSEKPKGWMANHSRWCSENPKRKEYTDNSFKAIEAMNAKRKVTGVTNHFSKARIEGRAIPAHHNKGISTEGKPHSEETKQLLRVKALASPHRRLRRKLINYNGVILDSTWELALAKRLDNLGIKWCRPDPIVWIDGENIKHHYFPDFYLIDYDLYLDPKNPQAIKVQQNKLKFLLTQHKNIVILETIEQCEQFTL